MDGFSFSETLRKSKDSHALRSNLSYGPLQMATRSSGTKPSVTFFAFDATRCGCNFVKRFATATSALISEATIWG
ncbi:unnamed protein product [Bathycoccus prasinos]